MMPSRTRFAVCLAIGSGYLSLLPHGPVVRAYALPRRVPGYAWLPTALAYLLNTTVQRAIALVYRCTYTDLCRPS